MTMDINPHVQDKNKMSSLMHAAEHYALDFLVDDLLKSNDDYIYFTDKNGETPFFHAANNPNILERLILSNIDINSQNDNKDTVLLYCCKNDLVKSVDILINKSARIDLDITDKEGRTAPMYLIDHGHFKSLEAILRKKTFNINYYNKNNNESFVSLLIKKYQDMFVGKKFYEICNSKDINKIVYYAIVFFLTYSYKNCDFNAAIDEVGNTPLMFFMMIKDCATISYILSDYENIDLSVKNKYGISASLLSALVDKEETFLINAILEHKTFDPQCTDNFNNNLLIYSVLCDNPYMFSKMVNEKSINHLNNNKENAVIIASKLGFLEEISSYYIRDVNINQQDSLGNTAIYYAIKIKDKYAINLLAYNKADVHIKNNDGVSAFDLAQQLDEENDKKDILKILKKPVPPHEMKKKLSKGSKSFFKKKDSDEKLNDYIKNYQINNYQEKYNNFLKDNITYDAMEKIYKLQERLALTFYVLKRRKNYVPINYVNVKDIEDRVTNNRNNTHIHLTLNDVLEL